MIYSDEEYAALPSLADADALTVAKAAYEILDEKKGHDLKILHVADKTVLCEYFVFVTGNSSTQVQALAGELEHRLGLRHLKPYHIEGRDNRSWIVADFSHVIVHIFSRDAREFYNLDKLYGDAAQIEMPHEDENV